MTQDRKGRPDFVNQVRSETSQYMRDLLRDNEVIRSQLGFLAGENDRLRDEVRIYKRELASQVEEHKRLKDLLESAQQDRNVFSDRFVEVEQLNNDLANLYVAAYRLHAKLDPKAVHEAMLEIVINMIGSEEVGVYELAPGGRELGLSASFGLDEGTYGSIKLGVGPLGRVAAAGETFIVGVSPIEGIETKSLGLTACLPLKVEGELIGLIAIFSLLGQKSGLEPIDLELIELLAEHGAQALYNARLHESQRHTLREVAR